ncbi:MAG TPA: tetratricopeptide repeat protein, partial [Longimicrobiales bacterium]|nr:tetratricopeptide repeat protein [Longimicrobiales bacterium]
RVLDALRRMRQPDALLTPEIAHEVAVREGADLVILPSIARIGARYTLALRLERPGSGERLRTLSRRASETDEILPALDDIAAQLRAFLGESPGALQQQNVSLFEGTTASLPALQAFSKGREEHARGRFPDALQHYRTALQLDSTFSIANSALGMLLFERGQQDSARHYMQRARAGLGDLTQREQLNLRTTASLVLDGDMEAAAGYQRALLALYPDHYGAHNNLGRISWLQGKEQEAAKHYHRTLEIYPRLDIAYDGLLYLYLYRFGQLDSALVWSRRQVEHDPTRFDAYNNLGWAYMGVDSLEQAVVTFRRALELDPDYVSPYGAQAASAELVRFRLAHAYRLLGRHRDAERILLEVLRRDSTVASAYYTLGVVHEAAGDSAAADAAYERFLTLIRGDEQRAPTARGQLMLSAVLARLNRTREADTARLRALRMDSTLHFENGLTLAVLDRHDEAMVAFELAIANGFRNYVWLYIHPDVDALRPSAQFQALVSRVLHRTDA